MKAIFTILFLSVIIAGCTKKPDTGDIVAALKGTWQEEEQQPSFAGTTYRIIFGDSATFRLKLLYYTDAIQPGNPCNNSRFKYMRGLYEAQGGVIKLDGEYCDSTFSIRLPDNCTGDTAFYEAHPYYFQSGDLVFKTYQNSGERIVMHKQ